MHSTFKCCCDTPDMGADNAVSNSPSSQDVTCQHFNAKLDVAFGKHVPFLCGNFILRNASWTETVQISGMLDIRHTWGESKRSDGLVMAFKDRDELASLNIKDDNCANLCAAGNQFAIWAVGHTHDKPLTLMFVISLNFRMSNQLIAPH